MLDVITLIIVAVVITTISIEVVNAAFRHPDGAIWVLTVFGTAAAFVAAFVFLPLLK